MENPIAKLYQSPKTVLTSKDLALLWQETNPAKLKAKAAYYVKQGTLIRLTRSVFAKNKDYDPRELATSIYIPSYISFETVLRDGGVIFQHYDRLFVAARRSNTLEIDQSTITFKKLKDEVLFNPAGIILNDTYSIASPERAFLDTIYLSPQYYFDNLTELDWEKCFELAPLYKNKQMLKRLEGIYKAYAE